MRLHILTAAIVLAGSPALGSSIEYLTTTPRPESESVAIVHCKGCPDIKAPERKRSYVTPELAPGTQRTEIRDVNGEKKLARTEAWFGGSPVVFMSKLPADFALAAAPDAAPAGTDAIDASATTSALPGAKPAATPADGDRSAKATGDIDPAKFELRLN